jgi:hypothetical protein
MVKHPWRKLTIVKDPAGALTAEITIDSVAVNEGETLDQSFIFIRFQSGDNNIYHYYFTDISRGIARYFPREGYATRWYGKYIDFIGYIHPRGFTWGFSTFATTLMENLSKNPDSLRGFFHDELIRHFEFYLEHQSPYGLLPYLYLDGNLARQTKDTTQIYPNFLFAQAGVTDLGFAREFIPTLPKDERLAIFKDISRIDSLYDPTKPLSWTVVLPNGSYWFEYSNLWKSEGYLTRVINSHVTALRVALEMEDMAVRMNSETEMAFWDNVVKKGTDAFVDCVSDEKNWATTPAGAYELVYAIGGQPTQHYQQGITAELTVVMNQGLLTYRKDDIVREFFNRKPK